MEDVAAADGVAGDHGDHRLGQASDLHLEVEYVQPADALPGDGVVADVAVVPPDRLVAPRAEGVGSLAGQDDGSDGRVVPGQVEGVSSTRRGSGVGRRCAPRDEQMVSLAMPSATSKRMSR